MKQSTLMSCAAAALLAAAPAAHAADGTITFTGKLSASTCKIDVNGGGASTSVTLPVVSTNALAANGSTAGKTAFSIKLTGCAHDESNKVTVRTYFESGPNVDLATGLLNNTAADGEAAKNVKLALIDPQTNTDIKIGDPSQMANNLAVEVQPDGTASMPVSVAYRATGATTGGNVQSAVTYSIIYQ
ncbi:fimbrial protein [Burkholderia sp. 22PA0106]|uniref:fimbrial protein n=1 Tax=Burkholderia sp. 22PA0106 TaxID=3237371 RepID=UPI0039C4C636